MCNPIRQSGLTFIELMIVVLIIGVLAAIAYPSYTAYVERTRVAEVKSQVMELSSIMERYRAQNFSYKDATIANLMPSVLNSRFYDVGLDVSSSPHQSYTITAVPKGTMSGTGALVLNSKGESCFNEGSDTACVPSSTSNWGD